MTVTVGTSSGKVLSWPGVWSRLAFVSSRFTTGSITDRQPTGTRMKMSSAGSRTIWLPADQSFAALIADLGNRGLLKETLVIAMGEFGRTPKINGNAGRDHWPNCYSVVLAGGGVRGGVTYGSSDKMGAYPDSDAVSPGDLAATLFWRFGLDPAQEMVDLTGRPYTLASGQPITALFG